MSKKEFDYLFKLVLIGDASVGKTCLLHRFADDSFEDNYISTVGVDFRFRTVTVDNKLVKLQIWDTAGQERFRRITAAYYKGAHGVILVYDITSEESFEHVREWLAEVHNCTGEDVTKLVVGNKSDLVDRREVDADTAKGYADSVNASWIETSSKTGINVDSCFFTIATTLVSKSDSQPSSKSQKAPQLATATVERTDSGGCCNCSCTVL